MQRKLFRLVNKIQKLTERQYKAFFDIVNCRTETIGFHIDQCDLCGHTEISYNTCRNRNCPKCQSNKQISWVQDRLNDLLSVTYYHCVFTLPNQTLPIAIYNQKIFYDLMFSSSADTLEQFATNPKWWDWSGYDHFLETVDIQLGFFSHPAHLWTHIHIIAAGGAINDDGQWIWPKYAKMFLFPVKAMARVFGGKFIEGLKKACCND